MSPSNTEVHIYAKKAGKWEVEHVLREHGSRVTGMDWAKKSDNLVTCGAVSQLIKLSIVVDLIIPKSLTFSFFRIVMLTCGVSKMAPGSLHL